MRRGLWILLMAIFIALSSGWYIVGEKTVEVWLNLSKLLVRNSSEVGFSYSGIDSLFTIRNYKYFMFVDTSFDDEISLVGLEDSVLVLISNKAMLNGMKSDMFLLPESSLEYWVNNDIPLKLYRIKEVYQREKGNIYRLRKIE